VSDDQRCPARSRITGEQCALPRYHGGRHARSLAFTIEDYAADNLWTEPAPEDPLTLGHFLDEMRDLEAHARDEGFVRLADKLRTLRAIITLDWPSFDRPAPAAPAATPRT